MFVLAFARDFDRIVSWCGFALDRLRASEPPHHDAQQLELPHLLPEKARRTHILKEASMAFGLIDPARLEGAALQRWYRQHLIKIYCIALILK